MGNGANKKSDKDSTLNKDKAVIRGPTHASTDLAVTNDNKTYVDPVIKNEASSNKYSYKQEEHVSRESFQDKKTNLETIQNNIKKLQDNVSYHIVEDACQRLDDLQKKEVHISIREQSENGKEPKASFIEMRTMQKREKLKLILKLSEMASQRLRANNAAITDLSDPNRATKISERFSELYDNQWTDVFEWLTHRKNASDSEAIGILRDMFKMCCDECKDVASSQRLCIIGYLKLLPNATSKDIELCSPALLHRLQEFQKITSHRTIGNLRKIIIDRIGKDVTKQTTKQYKLHQNKHGIAFVNQAVDVCWNSHIQSPPLAFIFEPSSELAGTHFKPYTASGTELDYVVWPAMLLHESGPILFKGIAQFKVKPEERKHETNQITQVTDPILEKDSNINSQESNVNASDWD